MSRIQSEELPTMKTQRVSAYLYYCFTGFAQVRLLRVDR